MLRKLVMLAAAFGLLGELATASCTPGYAGSGYYQTRDCGLRLGGGYRSPGYSVGYGPGYGTLGYGTIDALVPTLYGPPLSYGYGGAAYAPAIPNWYPGPFLGAPIPYGTGGYGYGSPGRSYTRVRPRRQSFNIRNLLPGTIRPGLRSGLGDLVGGGNRTRLARITQLNNGVWINP